MNQNLTAVAKDNMVRISPTKLSVLVNSIVDLKVNLAINQLMSVTRNFFMGRELTSTFGLLRMDEMDKIAHEEMKKIGIDFSDPSQAVGTMSGGQRQRIGIARALYFNPQVLILDEATSALDNLTEKYVIDAVNNLSKHKTIIMIAHRLSTVKKCDKIFLFEKGELKNEGTFDELINTNENFKKSVIN